jgi:hypothetical protein
MQPLAITLKIPVGDTGTISLAIDVEDLGQLTRAQRQALADTAEDFFTFTGQTLAPAAPVPQPPSVHNPDAAVLGGVTGSRANKT